MTLRLLSLSVAILLYGAAPACAALCVCLGHATPGWAVALLLSAWVGGYVHHSAGAERDRVRLEADIAQLSRTNKEWFSDLRDLRREAAELKARLARIDAAPFAVQEGMPWPRS